jgi:carbon storage regulator CsrA
MLILTRREGESIVIFLPGIDDTIEVRVMKAASQVSLGIDAPREVKVLREELVQESGNGLGVGWHLHRVSA